MTIGKPVVLALFTAIAALLAPAAAAQPILIGQSAALTGSQAGFGKEMRDGGLAAFDEINKRGGGGEQREDYRFSYGHDCFLPFVTKTAH